MTIEVTPSRWPKYGTPEPLRVCPAWSSNARSSARVNRSPALGWSPRRWRDANPPAPRQAPHQAVASSSWRGNSDGRPEAAVDRATQSPESPIGIETTRAAVILAGSGQFALGVPGTLLGLRVLPLGAGPLLGRSRLLLLGVRLARCRAVANVARLNAALLLAARSRSEGRRDERQDHGARDDGDDDNRAHLSLLLGSTAFRAVSGYPAPRGQTGGERPPRCQLTLADQPVRGEGRRLLSPQMQVQSGGEAAARSVRDQNLLDRVGKTVVANVDDHGVDPDILVGGVELHRHLGAEGLERLLTPDADDARAGTCHPDVGDEGGAAR